MAIEDVLKKLTEAVEANTAALLKAGGGKPAAASSKPANAEDKAEDKPAAKPDASSDEDEVKAKRAKIKKLSIELVALMGTDEASAWLKQTKMPPPGKIGANKLDKATEVLQKKIEEEKAKAAESENENETGDETEGGDDSW